MTFPERRLAELDAISRTRSLTEAEQGEVILRAKQHRQNQRRRQRYYLDPRYRAACIARTRSYREPRA